MALPLSILFFLRQVSVKRILPLLIVLCFSAISAKSLSPVYIRDFVAPGIAQHNVNGAIVPYPNAPVILKTKTTVGSSVVHFNTIVLTADNNGNFQYTIPCYRDDTAGYGSSFEYSAKILGVSDGLSTVSTGSPRCEETNPTLLGVVTPTGSSNEADVQNAGESCPIIGQPVNATNGNMWLEQTDYNLSGIGENLKITRFYNSLTQQSSIFGFGWKSDYDESISNFNNEYLTLMSGTGRVVYFANHGNNIFSSASIGFYGQVVKNTDNTYTLTFKDGRVHKFSATGRLLWQKDRNGNQTTLSYDTNGFLTGITDGFGRTLTVTPNANGTVQQISDSIGTIATYEYFTDTILLKTVTYNDGSKYKFEYDTTTAPDKTLLKTVKDALDNILETHEYDSQGRATTSEKHGGVEKYTLDYSNWSASQPYTKVTYIKQTGDTPIETKYFFDKSKGRNVITKTEGVCSCGGAGSEVTTFEYDTKLNLKKKVDALLRETVYTYDSNGNRLTQTDVLGTETYTYNSFGQILTRTDRMGGVTTNTYNTTWQIG